MPCMVWGWAAQPISPRSTGAAAATAVSQSSWRLAHSTWRMGSQPSQSEEASRGVERQAASSAAPSSSRPSMMAAWRRSP